METEVTTTSLEMTSRTDFRPSVKEPPSFEARRLGIPLPELNRFFYASVGRDWFWLDRLDWSLAQWKEYTDRPGLETWVGSLQGTPAGYFELEAQPERIVEIVYFGLLPQFVGRGVGGALLTAAINRAWEMGAARVWVHTCTLDHPRALENYKARGFRVFKTETDLKTVPPAPPELWPGEKG